MPLSGSASAATTYSRSSSRVGRRRGSAVDEPAICRAGGLHDAFGERRVAVHDARDLRVPALERLGVDELLDEVDGLGAHDVAAHQLAVLLVADHLDDAAAVAVDGAGADRAVVDLADDDVEPLLARLLLGQPERADVGRAERRARDVWVLDRVRLQAGRVLDGDDALVGGLVGERRALDEVADRVDALCRGAQGTVDLDQAAVVELDAGPVEPE